MGCVPPPAAGSPVSWVWSERPTVRICTGVRVSHLSSASAAGPLPEPAGRDSLESLWGGVGVAWIFRM